MTFYNFSVWLWRYFPHSQSCTCGQCLWWNFEENLQLHTLWNVQLGCICYGDVPGRILGSLKCFCDILPDVVPLTNCEICSCQHAVCRLPLLWNFKQPAQEYKWPLSHIRSKLLQLSKEGCLNITNLLHPGSVASCTYCLTRIWWLLFRFVVNFVDFGTRMPTYYRCLDEWQ